MYYLFWNIFWGCVHDLSGWSDSTSGLTPIVAYIFWLMLMIGICLWKHLQFGFLFLSLKFFSFKKIEGATSPDVTCVGTDSWKIYTWHFGSFLHEIFSYDFYKWFFRPFLLWRWNRHEKLTCDTLDYSCMKKISYNFHMN